MTVTQGLVLLRLVDRECGLSAYEIIRTYESGFAANFWQLVARLFSQNLKMRYDPAKGGEDAQIEELCWQLVARLFSQNLKMRYDPAKGGEDAQIEELCRIWDSGQWDSFYYSIFMEYPPKADIMTRTLESEVRKRNR